MKRFTAILKYYFVKYSPFFLLKWINIFQIKLGYKKYLKNGFTENSIHNALINLYCFTNGKYIEKLEKELRVIPISSNFPIQGVLGKNNFQFYQDIVKDLEEEGYFLFSKKLDLDSINDLLFFANNTKCYYPPNYSEPVIFNQSSLNAEIYRFTYQDLIANRTVQNLIMDESLIEIAREYFKSEPIFDFPAMWWSTSHLKEASSEAAQLYHFDFDRVKWLKLFIYLTDVGPDNGPHCYISGSHKVDSKPMDILKKGYARIKDNELTKYYENSQIKTLHGGAGTIFVGDTKCWHKGTPLNDGIRLVLELQYTTSLFGVNIPEVFVAREENIEFSNFCLNNKFYTQSIKIID